KSLIVLILEHLSFQFDKSVQVFFVAFLFALRALDFYMKQNRSFVRIQYIPRLIRSRSIRRTAKASTVTRTAELAFQSHPGRSDNAAWMYLFGMGRPRFDGQGAIFLQILICF